ncbi:LOW QUALITY PROTEIN: uncharacterized protein LOC106095247 [Stomoxys calcitrans]|uniref:LOW QUALITY PROTEIN: uncharacterized protein LOC106095247 n=1 Tax=Stomoxys calcitrans TaxID=35570 RepID=UPI0027E32AFA|nr:LOW QUALITY PROTEIN: uncharacterized protein LOC106095247 [Stomoxys calcitrans]
MDATTGFVVFQDDIPTFAETFGKASVYSKWRSQRNKISSCLHQENVKASLFNNHILKNSANILVIESEYKNSSKFAIKTNKFVGPLQENPDAIITLSHFSMQKKIFEPHVDFSSIDKLQNLQGRQLIVGAFDYRPFVVVDFERQPQYLDHALDNPRHAVHIDGTEMHIVLIFCQIYNCTIEVDTTEREEWGVMYPNYTATGLMGMTIDGKVHMVMGAMYLWELAYQSMDCTHYLGRSGVTCLVPAPKRIASWTLILKPFQNSLWLLLFGYLIFETVILYLARQFEEHWRVQRVHRKTWKSSIWFAFVSSTKLLVSQSSKFVINSNTLRAILCTCYMADMILTGTYGGGLAAVLTQPALQEVADSVERLYSHNLSWTASSYVFITSIDNRHNPDSTTFDPIMERLVSNFFISSIDQMRSLAKTENIGFALEKMQYGHFGNIKFLSPESLSRLKLMVDDIYHQYTVAMVPRLWAYLPNYNQLILTWHASGLSKYWEWKIAADYLNSREQDQVATSMFSKLDRGAEKLNLENFAGIMILWIFGIAMSIVVFIGEWVVHAIQRKWKERI